MEIVIAAALLAIGLVAAVTRAASRPRPRPPGAGTLPAPAAPALRRGREQPSAAPEVPVAPARARHARRGRRADPARARARGPRARRSRRATARVEGEQRRLTEELERIAGLSAAQAKQAAPQGGRGPGAPRRGAHRSARSRRRPSATPSAACATILSVGMQRLAAGHAAETTVSVVQLPSDDMKGRIIGREGRNIRALENLTGVDFIIDDTPNAVVLSGFDGVRREVARMTLEKLLPGRAHPPGADRGDLLPGQVRARRATSSSSGRRRCSRPTSRASTPSSPSYLGRLRFRTSYGQNVLAHSVECAHLAAMMAHELGASAKTARRAALLHDIGKAVIARDRGPARARRRRPRPPPRRARGRRPRDGGPPQRGRAPDRRGGDRPGRRRAVAARARARAASRSSSTSSACATSSRSPSATPASTRSTRCRPAARSA